MKIEYVIECTSFEQAIETIKEIKKEHRKSNDTLEIKIRLCLPH